jgi:hypothetical protein
MILVNFLFVFLKSFSLVSSIGIILVIPGNNFPEPLGEYFLFGLKLF